MSPKDLADWLEQALVKADATALEYYPDPPDFGTRNAHKVGYLTGAIEFAVDQIRAAVDQAAEAAALAEAEQWGQGKPDSGLTDWERELLERDNDPAHPEDPDATRDRGIADEMGAL